MIIVYEPVVTPPMRLLSCWSMKSRSIVPWWLHQPCNRSNNSI